MFLIADLLVDRADIGLIGLAVMGQNLILNMNDHDFTVDNLSIDLVDIDRLINLGCLF